MKKLLLLCVAVLTLASCDDNEDFTPTQYEFLPTESAIVPETMELGEAYDISLEYIKPSDCYHFADLYFDESTKDIEDEDGNLVKTTILTVAVVNSVDIESECIDNENEELSEAGFAYTPITEGAHIIRFWVASGSDDTTDEDDIFLEYETMVAKDLE
ncbi:hypothetical protein [Formosa haliotis]|uniref:hypothetical protein n=1 Tax=Formosa haliotis TaxID=1555194 RepID=UPI00082621BB|nr:hypothetical protein [Formosa haliotis]